MSRNVILDKTFQFACRILDLNKRLIEEKHFALANQLIRSGTSIGANVREAQRAVSNPDFAHKLSIALSEADETKYWLELIDVKVFSVDEILKTEINEIISLLVSIIKTTKANNKK